GALTADDDARAGGVDVDADPVAGALDVHFGDTGPLQALRHRPADLHVLGDVVLVELVRVPARLPVGRDAEPEPGGVNFLTHYSVSSSAALVAFFAAFLAGVAAAPSALSAVAFLAAFLAGAAGVSTTVSSTSVTSTSSTGAEVALAAVALAAPRPVV